MAGKALGNVFATSQSAGSKWPIHVIVTDADGNVMDFDGGSTQWEATHVPAANTVATVSKAAAGAGVRNVCTGFTVAIASGAVAPTATQLTVALIDGAAGGATYIWRAVIALPAVAGATTAYVRSHCWLPGSANTAMTLEFSGAGGANTYQSVSMDGTTTA